MVQLHDVLTVPVNSFDGITMQTIRTVLRDYHAKYRRGGLHVALILIAVFIRRLRKSSEISAYLLSSQSETSGRTRIMGRLEKMGVVQLLELDGSGDKTKLLVFPVEQQ